MGHDSGVLFYLATTLPTWYGMMGVLCMTSLIGSGVAGVAIHSPFRLFWNMTDCFNAWRIYERLWFFSFVFLSAERCGRFRVE